nr:site-specific integrase [Marinicella sp. W31]MDC2875688.1 site-specific integrase [Marinicella sp. W31]
MDLSGAHIEAFIEMLSAERGAANNTLSAYQRDLDDFRDFLIDRGVVADRARAEDITAYLAGLGKRGFAASSQSRRLSAIRQFYQFLYGEGLREDDPTGVIDAPKKRNPCRRRFRSPMSTGFWNARRLRRARRVPVSSSA